MSSLELDLRSVKGFLVAFAVALAITFAVEVVRWLRKREGAPS